MPKNPPIKKVAITTGGGDAPGLNAVIRAAVLSALNHGWEVVGIREGYGGILDPQNCIEGGFIELSRQSVEGITHLGGTILGTTNRGNPMQWPVTGEDGQVREVDRTDEVVQALKAKGVDALIAVGGDGSLTIAHALARKGVRVVGVPKTIDNDLDQTVVTFGFDTAVSFATECVDRLHSTAAAHRRIIVVEVMGRYAGWIALHAGVSGSADAILIPEIPFDLEPVAEKIRQCEERGQCYAIVVIAEGAVPRGGSRFVLEKEMGRAERLGGIGGKVAASLQELTGKEARAVVLGHLLRGGTPTTFDRLISLRFGAAAIRALEEGRSGIMVALDPPTVRYVPLEKATRRMKTVPLDSDTILTARDLGISFGDAPPARGQAKEPRAGAKAMSDRKRYQKKIEEEFNQLSARIDELLRKVEVRARSEYKKQAESLPNKLEAARKKLEELKKSSNEAWEDLKPGFEKAWGELKKSFQDAASRFK